MKPLIYSFVLILITNLLACVSPPDYTDEPVIEFLRLSRDRMEQGNLAEDSISVIISFTDGDGDIGHNDSLNLFVTDIRPSGVTQYIRMPFVPEQGTGNGISGEIRFPIFQVCCRYENPNLFPCDSHESIPIDTVIFEIYIRDRANNMSNVVETEPVILLCN